MFTVRVDFETCRYEPEVPGGVWGAVAGGSMPPVAAVRLAVQSPSVPSGFGVCIYVLMCLCMIVLEYFSLNVWIDD